MAAPALTRELSRFPLTILMVDDSDLHLEITKKMLSGDSTNHQFFGYHNTEDASNYLSKHPQPDCLLLDLHMPGKNGIEFQREIREQYPTLPVVFCSGDSDEKLALKSIAEGADDYLVKGEYNHMVLMRAIRYAIERKRFNLEHQRVCKELIKQQQLNERQLEFVSLVSHEFRTPLSVIHSSAQLMERQLKEQTHPEIQRHIHKIYQSIKRLTRMVDNTLLLSQMEHGSIQPKPCYFNFQQMMEELLEHYREQFSNQPLEYHGDPLPTHFWGDHDTCEHAITNLINNAFKYSQGSAEPITIFTSVSDEHVVIRIRDHGCGIPKADIASIGQKFFRANNTVGIKGAGIGVYITQQFLAINGATLSYKSAQGKGTEALVTFTRKGEGDAKR